MRTVLAFDSALCELASGKSAAECFSGSSQAPSQALFTLMIHQPNRFFCSPDYSLILADSALVFSWLAGADSNTHRPPTAQRFTPIRF
jgi:hypothetical protein